MANARTFLHVLITFAVVLHGAWMAAMPIAHAAPVVEAEAVAETGHSAQSAHDSHAHHAGHHPAHHSGHHSAHHTGHGHHDASSEAHHDCAESDEVHAEHTSEHSGGHHDHDMSGCECTLCKSIGVFAVDIELGLVALTHLDERPRVHPAQQVRVTTGPPVGLRAPPFFL